MVSGSRWMAFAGVSLILIAGITGVAWSGPGSGGARRTSVGKEPGGADKTTKDAGKGITQRIDLNGAMNVSLPEPASDLKSVSFATDDGKTGWVLRLPGNRPIATPAYDNGMLFVGGGYGSHEFYAIDSDTGKIIWKIQTGDDGPTGAVVYDGAVAFNTESCTLVVVDEKTGRLLWQEWLGDPLMSQPAIDKDVLYMAHPAATGRPEKHEEKYHPRPATPGGGHRLLAAELKTGRHIWEQQIAGDVITAPVISDGAVYFTTFDGTSYSLNAADGEVIWVKRNAATSAPVVSGGNLYETRKQQAGKDTNEGLARVDARKGDAKDKELLAAGNADYLESRNGGGVALSAAQVAAMDASVGFSAAPSSAQLKSAAQNVGVNTVVGAWAYQGSRAALSKGLVLNAQGNKINSVRAADGKQTWQADVVGGKSGPNSQLFSPPSVGRDYMYLVGAGGYLLSVRQSDGRVGFSYALKAPMTFQPALAKGNVYVGSADGRLICLKTASKDADGWYEWGGNAQHNKVQ